VNTRHCYMGRISTARLNNLFMNISMLGQTRIAAPTVCLYNGTWLYRLAYKWYQTFSRYIWDAFHSYSPISFRVMDFKSNNNGFFALGTSTSLSPCLLTPDISFINFNSTVKTVSPWSDHCTPQFMQPSPGRLIATQTKSAFDAESTCTIFLARNKPKSVEPRP